MALKDLKNKLFGNSVNEEGTNASSDEGFCFGVEAVFSLSGSKDCIAAGRAYGRINKGDAVYVSNPGADFGEIGLTTVDGIEADRKQVPSIENVMAAIRVKDGTKFDIKPGTVLHSRNASMKVVHDAYIGGLAGGYLEFQRMKLEQSDLDAMSLTDLAELFKYFSWRIKNGDKEKYKDIIDRSKEIYEILGKTICSKILALDEVYFLMSKKTGEPQMMSVTYEREDGNYMTTPPEILLVTKAYIDVWKKNFDPEKFEFIRIQNGEDKKGIYNFLGSTFYVNGACGVQLIYREISIVADMLVKKPDYSGVPEIQIPVTNPDLERWLLLIGQLDKATTPEEEKLHGILYSHLFRELAAAKFIVPMKLDREPGKTDDPGMVTLKQDTKMSLATQQGKYDRDALRMYTDWKRFRRVYKEEDGWNGLIQPISGVIDQFDCAINVTEYTAAGCYVDKEFYENSILKFVQQEKEQ